MSTEFIELLDTALERLRRKDSIPEILENYAEQVEYLEPLLYTAEALNSVPPVELPSAEAMQIDRAEFFASIGYAQIPSVLASFLVRLKERARLFAHDIKSNYLSPRKEKRKMNTLFARTVLLFILIFGMASGGYALTESSLPGSPFYAAKLALEQTQLQMKSDPAGIANQHLVIVKHRIKEIKRLAQAGKEPDEGAMTSFEYHLNAAFQLAAQMGDGEMLGVLTQAINMLEKLIQQMTQTQAHVSSSTQAQLQLVIQLLTQAQNQAELGLQNPDAFRLQFSNGPSSEQPVPGEPTGDQNQDHDQDQDHDDDQDQDHDDGQDQDHDQDHDNDQDHDQDHDNDQDHDQDQNHDQDHDDDQDIDQDHDDDQDQEDDQDHDQDHDDDQDQDDDQDSGQDQGGDQDQDSDQDQDQDHGPVAD